MEQIAACLLAKNEAPYLAEWIAYHLAIGFSQIVVYDNASTDDTAALIRRIGSKVSGVRRVDWPDVTGSAPQKRAYAHALQHIDADWIAFIDADEFIVLKEHDTIDEFLSAFDQSTGAICLNWLIFGSSGHLAATDDLVIKRFDRCSEPDFQTNRHVKSIVRRTHVGRMHVHAPELAAGYHRLADGRPADLSGYARSSEIVHSPALINHYVLKSADEFARKVARGQGDRAPDDPARRAKFTEGFWRHHDRNERADHSAMSRLSAIENLLREFRG